MYPSLFSLSKRLIALALIGATLYTCALTPITVLAQELPQENSQSEPDASLFGTQDEQTQAVVDPSRTNSQNNNSTGQAATSIATNATACSASTLLGKVLSTAIADLISDLIGSFVADKAASVVDVSSVPTTPGGPLLDNTKLQTRAHSGTTFFGAFTGISWDSIAWCVVNAMIEHIANATIAWANSGFNGNPAFIENPERFFKDFADYQAGSIIRDIAYGASKGQLNVCRPFKVSIAVGLAQGYSGGGNGYRNMSCKLSDITQNRFFDGVTVSVGSNGQSGGSRASRNITWGDWANVTQNDSNNPYGSYLLANQALYSKINLKQNELRFEVGMNNGWLSFKKCKDPKDPDTCNTTTPGRLIESSLNQTLGLSKQRLIMADKFDQMVTAIVDNLIKVALNKVLEQ